MISENSTQNPSLTYRLDDTILSISQSLTIKEIDLDNNVLLHSLLTYQQEELYVDLQNLKEIDSAGVALLQHIVHISKEKNIRVEFRGVPENIQVSIDTFSASHPEKKKPSKKEKLLDRIGGHGFHFLQVVLRDYIYLLADLFYWSLSDFFGHNKARRKGESVNQAVIIGVNAVPIVGLISLMIGLVLALQSAAQLRQFGANIFIVDLIVIAMTREMGPLITAIPLLPLKWVQW
jgi:phospholipid/cholesterol/gamma-HCH transport system permease protein